MWSTSSYAVQCIGSCIFVERKEILRRDRMGTFLSWVQDTWESLGFDFCATLARDVTNSPLKLGEASEWSFLVLFKFNI